MHIEIIALCARVRSITSVLMKVYKLFMLNIARYCLSATVYAIFHIRSIIIDLGRVSERLNERA